LLRGRHKQHVAGDYSDVTATGERMFMSDDGKGAEPA